MGSSSTNARRRRFRHYRHEQFMLVDGKWSVNVHTILRGDHVLWRCQLLEQVDGATLAVGRPHTVGTRTHAERWAEREFQLAKQKELCRA